MLSVHNFTCCKKGRLIYLQGGWEKKFSLFLHFNIWLFYWEIYVVYNWNYKFIFLIAVFNSLNHPVNIFNYIKWIFDKPFLEPPPTPQATIEKRRKVILKPLFFFPDDWRTRVYWETSYLYIYENICIKILVLI